MDPRVKPTGDACERAVLNQRNWKTPWRGGFDSGVRIKRRGEGPRAG